MIGNRLPINETSYYLVKVGKQNYYLICLIIILFRNNRFGGTFELGQTRSLTERPMIYHHDIMAGLNKSMYSLDDRNKSNQIEENIGLVNLGTDKRVFRKSKIRKPMMERTLYRQSIVSVQTYLQVGFFL